MLHNAQTRSLTHSLFSTLLPLLLASVFITACNDASTPPEKQEEKKTYTREVAKTPIDPEISEELKAQQEELSKVKTYPSFNGGQEALAMYLQANLKYPEKEKKEGISETIFMNFKVNTDGTISDVKNINGENQNLIDASIAAILDMPNWVPGKDEDGNPLTVAMTLPIKWIIEE